jgi:hypothetical protein
MLGGDQNNILLGNRSFPRFLLSEGSLTVASLGSFLAGCKQTIKADCTGGCMEMFTIA